MSLYLVHRQTPTSPAEYESDNPWRCARCGDELDRDDDSRFPTIDGDCCRSCLKRCVVCDELVEGEDAVSEACWFDSEPHCDLCFGAILCGGNLK